MATITADIKPMSKESRVPIFRFFMVMAGQIDRQMRLRESI
jgi:hypothetical protein